MGRDWLPMSIKMSRSTDFIRHVVVAIAMSVGIVAVVVESTFEVFIM
jgi:hypothetical protein